MSRSEPTAIEKLVREKDELTRLERELDMYLVHMRVGTNPRTEVEAPKMRRMAFSRHRRVGEQGEQYETIPGPIVREFYRHIQTRLGETRDRLRQIELVLTEISKTTDSKEN